MKIGTSNHINLLINIFFLMNNILQYFKKTTKIKMRILFRLQNKMNFIMFTFLNNLSNFKFNSCFMLNYMIFNT